MGPHLNSNLQLNAASASDTEVFKHFKAAKYSSIKLDSFFQVYEQIFRKYVGQRIVFVEVGVLNGGSLFMWRNYFGPNARIIGVEINPIAKRWEEDGFEIYIGSQSDPQFWDEFYQKTGPVDILLDDGGHTNPQQIVTVHKAIANVNDGGVIVVEDVHASYLRQFGNPSKYSFLKFAHRVVDAVNSRVPAVKAVRSDYGTRVFSVCFFESIVVFNIDSRRCVASSVISNDGATVDAKDMRYEGSVQGSFNALWARLAFIERVPLLRRIRVIFPLVRAALARMDSRRSKDLFR